MILQSETLGAQWIKKTNKQKNDFSFCRFILPCYVLIVTLTEQSKQVKCLFPSMKEFLIWGLWHFIEKRVNTNDEPWKEKNPDQHKASWIQRELQLVPNVLFEIDIQSYLSFPIHVINSDSQPQEVSG